MSPGKHLFCLGVENQSAFNLDSPQLQVRTYVGPLYKNTLTIETIINTTLTIVYIELPRELSYYVEYLPDCLVKMRK